MSARQRRPTTFDLRWRNEDYGVYSGALSAFRFVQDPDGPDWSETARKALRGFFTRAGYQFAESRGCWITYKPGSRAELCHALEDAGYTVTHAGCWSPEQDQ